jgi:hypothetical protein
MAGVGLERTQCVSRTFARLRALSLKQRLQVLRRGFELLLGQAHDYWLGELESGLDMPSWVRRAM